MLLCTAFAVACGGGNEGEDSGNDQNQNVPEVPSHPDFEFVLIEDGNSYAITGHKAGYNKTTFEIPSTFDGKPVTEIRNGSYRKQLVTEVIIPDSITTIGNSAFFGYSELTTVSMGANVKTIGTNGFGACSKLSSITLPNGLEEIGNQAFFDTALAEVKIPGSVKVIRRAAFRDNKNLVTVKLLDGIEKIEDKAFNGCTNLANVTLGDGLKYMGGEVFSGTHFQNNDLNYSNDIRDALYLNDVLVKVKEGDDTFTVRPGTRVLADRCISGSYDTINLPKSLRYYSNDAITCYYYLTAINVEEDNEFFKSVDGNLYSKDGKTLYKFCGANTNENLVYEIPAGVTTIATGAFKGCKFNTLTVANDVTTLGKAVFSEAKIKNVVLGAGVTTIGEEGISNISKIETFTFQGTVAEWEAIEKDEKFYFLNYVDYIQCSDGQVVNPYKASQS